jgi:hypothetical protein
VDSAAFDALENEDSVVAVLVVEPDFLLVENLRRFLGSLGGFKGFT